MIKKTPASLGYVFPAEWEKHKAVWMAWPYDTDSFPDIPAVERTFVSIIQTLENSEAVNLLVRDASMENHVQDLLQRDSVKTQIEFFHADYADVWFRDYGPIFLKHRTSGTLAIAKWTYHAYGKYPELLKDNEIPYRMNEKFQLPLFEPKMILEGGSIDSNGKGTLLTTRQCLLNKNRNPHLSKQDIEKRLQDFLGVQNIIWLEEGVEGDDTDGHVDDIARFVDPQTILACYEEDIQDHNFSALKKNYEILLLAKDQDGQLLHIVKLPVPKIFGSNKRRLPASYANFYIANTKVLVPIFSDTSDAAALEIIQKYFPEREVIGINCVALVSGNGTIHCATREEPWDF